MTSVVQFRMDSEDKEILEIMLKDMGLDLGTAFRMFAAKVLKTGEIPFSISSEIDPIHFGQRTMKKLIKEL